MIETGTISEVKGDRVTIGCSSEVCDSCSSSFCGTGKRVFEAVNPKGFPIRPGDTVEVYLPTGGTIAAGFVALILPLIMFVALYAASGSLVSGAGEALRALFGVGGLAAGFGLSLLYGRLRPGRQYPAIVAVKNPPPVTSRNGGSQQAR